MNGIINDDSNFCIKIENLEGENTPSYIKEYSEALWKYSYGSEASKSEWKTSLGQSE